MRVGIVGAGIAGLAAARELARAGSRPTVFEASESVGGRCLTEVLGPYVFDAGAPSITPRGMSIEEALLSELDRSGLVEIEAPIYIHDGRRAFPGDGSAPEVRHYCYRQGMGHLAELLADGLDVRLSTRADTIEIVAGGGYAICGEAFDAAVIATPTPDAAGLLSLAGDDRPMLNTRYRRCISVLLGFERPLDVPFHALTAEEAAHPLHWLSIESLKVPGGRAPEGHCAIVAQLGPRYSKWNFDSPDRQIVSDALVDIGRIFGEGFEAPAVQSVLRWEHGQTEHKSSFDKVNVPGATLVVAGDGLEGPRLEHAFESGMRAAWLLLGR
ncbi:MAG: FAD-dependent oxidoreductase [Armatimonadetes bacterium]|nr:FAD-dependent oxidoreductase [Armatimonadota bacterium]